VAPLADDGDTGRRGAWSWIAVKVWTNALPAVTLVTYRADPVSGSVCVMFVSDQRLCPVSIGAARARLVNLAHDGWLGRASAAAYHDGLDQLLRVGPFGEVPGLSRRVQAHFLDPVDRDGSVTLGMRWEATGVTGRLFPALDANITLTAEGDQHTQMTLTGVYRSPLGAFGAGLDRALLHHVATATIGSLLARMSEALEGTAPQPGDAGAPGWSQPGPQTAP
jgi:hypothetical protein